MKTIGNKEASTLDLGDASDTTIARVSAGVASIEGNNIITANVADATYLPKAVDATPNTDHTANGPQTNTLAAGYSSAIGDLVYFDPTAGEWLQADADAEASAGGVLLGIALEAKTDGQAMNVALPGSIVRDDTWNWTVGQELFVSTTAGAITGTAPSGTGDIVRVVGYALTADVIYFNPSGAWVEIA